MIQDFENRVYQKLNKAYKKQYHKNQYIYCIPKYNIYKKNANLEINVNQQKYSQNLADFQKYLCPNQMWTKQNVIGHLFIPGDSSQKSFIYP